MFVRCFCELNVCLDEYELFARPRVAGHYTTGIHKMGSEFLTPGNSEELSLIVSIQKMGSEFLTPDILWRLSIIVLVDAAVGSEFLTRDNLWKLSIIVPEQQFGFRISDP